MKVAVFTTLTMLTTLVGCASNYVPPGRAVDLQALGSPSAAEQQQQQGDYSIESKFQRQPMANFPASVAMVRVQDSGYRSTTAMTYGGGRYCVVTDRDVEADDQIAGLAKLPMLAGLAPINKLVLPSTLQSDYELRQAAATLQADMVLIYTLDTTFVRKDASTPLNLITLGITPTQEARITCTASAILMDTRSGYIYSLAEATESRHAHQNAWVTEAAVDNDRRAVERVAFGKLVTEVRNAWTTVVQRHAPAEIEAKQSS